MLIWAITTLTILLILIRPWQISEAVWAGAGALLLLVLGQISPREAWAAVGRGADVYLFLTGMMILAELGRREGFFDWLAALAVNAAKGSAKRLFAIVYLVGTLVTIFLSNDATAVVLTPAVLAASKKARATPLPFLLICAFIANAASFVLPIANPANLVVYGSQMPPLGAWMRSFAIPSLASILVTFAVLRWAVRKDLARPLQRQVEAPKLALAGKLAAVGIAGAAAALVIASALHIDLGLPTFAAALCAAFLVWLRDRAAPLGILKGISWSVIPLVAGLFVLVEATNQAGARTLSQSALQKAAALGEPLASLASAFGVALLCNVVNNLPVGLIAAGALHAAPVSAAVRNAVLIGVDLGPNLSVSGSLATILWLTAIRREGEAVSFWTFLRYGLLVMPPALLLAVLALR